MLYTFFDSIFVNATWFIVTFPPKLSSVKPFGPCKITDLVGDKIFMLWLAKDLRLFANRFSFALTPVMTTHDQKSA